MKTTNGLRSQIFNLPNWVRIETSTFLKMFFIWTLVITFLMSANADQLKKLAFKLSGGLKDQPNKKIAVISFPYPDDKMSSGSYIVQERLTTFLVENEKLEVIERNLLKKVMEEMKLEKTGIIDINTTKELGKLLGVGAIITGTLNDINTKTTEVNARAIQTETGKILTAGQTKIKRTWTDSPVRPDSTIPIDTTTHTTTGEFLGKPLIQISMLLDTSNSMDGLINQAKSQLWKIVNELSSSEKDGSNPIIQISLYEYGNDSLPPTENYLRQVIGFTTNLDKVSENLFSLTTRGGQEYCGAVIQNAVRTLGWNKHSDVYKAIFIAGNEPFTQGQVDFRVAIVEAVEKGIFVNTIFCGRYQEGVAGQWKAGSDSGNGEYLNIDQEVQIVSIKAPQDEEIQRLGNEINKTYIPYGTEGKKEYDLQKKQDNRVKELKAPAAEIERSVFKAKEQYSMEAVYWDIISAVENGKVKIEELKEEEFPEELKKMNIQERKNYIQKKIEEKKSIQKKINELNESRKKYITLKEEEIAKKSIQQTLDHVIIKAIHTQAAKKKFIFKE